MKSIAIFVALSFSSISFAGPQLTFTIAKIDEKMIIQSAGKTTGAEFALNLGDFLGTTVQIGFKLFGCVEETITSINSAFDSGENKELVYTNPKDNSRYRAGFMKMTNMDGKSTVNIFVSPEN